MRQDDRRPIGAEGASLGRCEASKGSRCRLSGAPGPSNPRGTRDRVDRRRCPSRERRTPGSTSFDTRRHLLFQNGGDPRRRLKATSAGHYRKLSAAIRRFHQSIRTGLSDFQVGVWVNRAICGKARQRRFEADGSHLERARSDSRSRHCPPLPSFGAHVPGTDPTRPCGKLLLRQGGQVPRSDLSRGPGAAGRRAGCRGRSSADLRPRRRAGWWRDCRAGPR